MKILQISDIHYNSAYQHGNSYQNMLTHMDNPLQRLQAFISQVTQENHIDIIAITGDLCDDGSSEDYHTLKQYFDSLNIPYVYCLGNHDIKEHFYQGFFNKCVDSAYLNITQYHGYNFISFDNSKYGYSNGYISANRLRWLEDTLSSYKNTILLMHHQLTDFSKGLPQCHDSPVIIDLITKYKPIAVLAGHTHWYYESNIQEVPYFVAPSFSFHAFDNPDGSLTFMQTQGYCTYELNDNVIKCVSHQEVEQKELSIIKF